MLFRKKITCALETVILLARLSRHLMCFSRNYNSVDVSTHLRSMSGTAPGTWDWTTSERCIHGA